MTSTLVRVILLACPCISVTVNLTGGDLKVATLEVPPVPPTSSLALTVSGGSGLLQVSSSFQGTLSSWNVHLDGAVNHSRPLCSNNNPRTTNKGVFLESSTLYLSLLSSSPGFTQQVMLNIEERPNFLLHLGQEVKFPSSQHSAFLFNSLEDAGWNEDQYMISIENPGGRCLEVGISRPSCPFKDDPEKVRNSEIWARVLTKGLFPVKAVDFMESMSIVVIPAKSQRDCYYDPDFLSYKQEDKPVTILVRKVGSDYATPTAYLLGALFIISIPTVGSLILFWIRKHQKEEEVELEPVECTSPAHVLQNVCESPAHDLDQVDASVDAEGRNSLRRRSTQALPELLRHFLSDPLHRYLRSDAYYHVVPLLVVFYSIPSFQLVFLTVEGNSEACYFNYGCARPWWIFKAFNHIYSNLGYIWFGLCFMLLVWIKSRYFKEQPSWQHGKKKRGLPQQYGLYYAMGLATIAQGLLSATFHICPSNLSLQFDTTMMYLIMTLAMVKIYQFRHPDTTVNAFYCLYLLALALIFEAISVHLMGFSRTTVSIFTAFFCILYLVFVLWLGNAFYLNKQSQRFKSRSAIECCSCLAITWLNVIVIFWFVVVNVCVLVYVVISVWGKEKSLSTPLLLVIGCNMFLYLGYYMTRKFGEIIMRIVEKDHRSYVIEKIGEIHDNPAAEEEDESSEGWLHWMARTLHITKCEAEKEAEAMDEKAEEVVRMEEEAKEEADSEGQCSVNMVRFLSYILFSLALILALVASGFYANKHQSRNLSPSQSREKNAECVFLDFYDNHDLWHFFSSLALFLAFTGLLTIDDDLLYVRMDRIKVF